MPPKVVKAIVPAPPSIPLDMALITKGEIYFNDYCGFCHQAGKPEEYFSQYPNLGMLTEATHSIFKDIVLDGVFAQNGMASFKDLLQEDAEIALAGLLLEKSAALTAFLADKQYTEGLAMLADLQTPVDKFFDQVMVMVDEPDVRANRLGLLKSLRELFLQVADISLLVVTK